MPKFVESQLIPLKAHTGHNRVCIYPKDIARITGKSERYGRKLIQQIKHHHSKQDFQLVTIDEFCEYMGLKTEQVSPFLT